MAKKAYIGVGGLARKVKRCYVGVGNVARKIKKAYIGVGGVARPFWNDGNLTYYGTVTALPASALCLAGGSTADHALFAGGAKAMAYGASEINNVSAYDKTLVRSLPAALSAVSKQFQGVSCGGRLLFPVFQTSVDAYNNDLTKSTIANGMSTARENSVFTAYNANYALLCGGYPSTGAVDAFDGNLTHYTPASLTDATYEGRGACVGPYALFGGGVYNGTNDVYIGKNSMNAYDLNLTKTIPPPLPEAMANIGAVSMSQYAVFAHHDVCIAYDKNLTRSNITSLSASRRGFAGAVSFHGYAIFAGGWNDSSALNTVDVYDENLVRTVNTSISEARSFGAGAVVGDYALFAGGWNGSSIFNTVDAYTLV